MVNVFSFSLLIDHFYLEECIGASVLTASNRIGFICQQNNVTIAHVTPPSDDPRVPFEKPSASFLSFWLRNPGMWTREETLVLLPRFP